MSTKICRNCGSKVDGNKCFKCGYEVDISNPFKNEIKNKYYKESIADMSLALLIDKNLISKEKDLKNLVVEFGYLLLPNGSDNVCALLKVMPPKRLFEKQRVFYLGTQEDKLLLLNESFNEAMFRKVSSDMLVMHKVDLDEVDRRDYIMKLY